MIRHRIVAVALAALAATAPQAQETAFTPAQREALDARIRGYLLENPEVLLEAFDILEQRRQAAQADNDAELVAMHADRLFQDPMSPVLGNPDGDVTVVKFSDYRCGYCKAAAPMIAELIGSDPGVRVVIKEFPILGEASVMAGRVALAAAMQGPDVYARLHEALLAHQGQLDDGTTLQVAERAGVDMTALRAAMEESSIADEIRNTYALARELGIEGTPSFVIGDRIVRGMMPLDGMRALVAEARNQDG
jgi:protein-disulfide isomerase